MASLSLTVWPWALQGLQCGQVGVLVNVPDAVLSSGFHDSGQGTASADLGPVPIGGWHHQGTLGSLVSPELEGSLRATSRMEERVLCSQVLLDACSSAEAQLSWWVKS